MRALLSTALAALFLCSACSDMDENYADKKVEDIYAEAMKNLEDKSYKKAAKVFGEVERNYPYSDLAIKSQLYSAYAYYEAGKYDESSEAFSFFVQLHPSHDEVPYAIYMMGMCAYEQVPILERDQESADTAITYFRDLIARFPHSDYAKDAKLKIDLVNDHLAAKEMNVGRYYMTRYSYVAAANRFKNVVDHFQRTNQVPEALYRLVEAYLALGLKDQAQAHAAILGHNYEKSPWYKKAFDLMNS